MSTSFNHAAGDEVSAAEYNSILDAVALYGVDAGSTDAYAVTLSPAPTALVAGLKIAIKVNTNNTLGATLNPNGLGNVAIVKNGSVALETNDFVAGRVYVLLHDGTNFQVISGLGEQILPVKGTSDINSTTTSDSVVTVATTGTITLTTKARRCLLSFAGDGGNSSTSAGGDVYVQIDSGTQYLCGSFISAGAGNQRFNLSFSFLSDVLSAASHDFKFQVVRVGGTGTFSFQGRFSVVELV